MKHAARIFGLAILAAGLIGSPLHAQDPVEGDSRWTEMFRLQVSAAAAGEQGDVDWAELVALDDSEFAPLTPPPVKRFDKPNESEAIAEWAATYARAMRRAYAHAALGHIEYARQIVATTRAGLDAARNCTNEEGGRADRLLAWVERQTVTKIAVQIEARIAHSEGRTADALQLAQAADLDGPTGTELAAAVGLAILPSRQERQKYELAMQTPAAQTSPVLVRGLALPAIAQIRSADAQSVGPDAKPRVAHAEAAPTGRFAWTVTHTGPNPLWRFADVTLYRLAYVNEAVLPIAASDRWGLAISDIARSLSPATASRFGFAP